MSKQQDRASQNMPERPEKDVEQQEAWSHLSKWDTLVDERIREIIGDGNMAWHPKAGQPLQLDDESIPEEFRLAYKLMKDNEAIPPWMALGYTLRDKHTKIHKRIQQYARDHHLRRQKAIEAGSFILHREADERWQKAIAQLRIDIGKYNSELLDYNLQVPPAVGQMVPIDADALIEQNQQRAMED